MWRETGLWPKVGLMGIEVDGRTSIMFVVWCVHWSWITFNAAIILIAILGVFEYFGYDIYYGARKIRRSIGGRSISTRRAGQHIS